MWRNWKHCALYVGIQNDAATVENSMALPQKDWEQNYDTIQQLHFLVLKARPLRDI